MLELDETRGPVPARDAATVVLLREPPGGLEVFLLRRHAKSGFLGGVHVFPGGVVDEGDRLESWRGRLEGGDADAPAASSLPFLVAAIRETFEEAGVLLASGVRDDEAAALRGRLLAGVAFVRLAEEAGLRLRVDALAAHARWITPQAERRRYDTRFFAACVRADERADADQRETTEGLWVRPGAALADEARGRIQLAPPTLRTLELLDDARDAATFLRTACGPEPRPTIEPHFALVEGEPTLMLPGDPAHPVRARALPGATRLVLRDGRWVPAVPDRPP